MGSYGRNFDFLQSPAPGERLGRYVQADDDDIPFGAPVVCDGDPLDDNGQLGLVLAAGAQAPLKTRAGICIFENPTSDIPGLDPVLAVSDDLDAAPVGKDVQLVSGLNTRIRLVNLDEFDLYGQRTYPARKMVAGLGGATPAIEEGDLLTPATTPNDTNGYWQKTTDRTEAWLVVTGVYNDVAELDAQFLF